MKLRLLSLAEDDLLAGYRFYQHQENGIGWYFLETLNSDIESLRLYAGVHPRVFGYYRLLSKRFPFAVYYDEHEEEIRVWRVLDCRRDPRWITAQGRKGRKSR